ncbi:MAG: HAMP domain-containing histidine kinase [bacterium]|nr:HAMP domain-containing histidine kinase [Candidatus Kapabacteria bacterium]
MIDRSDEEATAAQPSLGHFMRLLAHELGNPVATIRMSAEMIQSTVPPEMQAQLSTMILEEAIHLEELIARALFYTAMSEPADVEADVGQILSSVAQQFPSVAITIGSSEPLNLRCDPGQLGRMIGEAVSNAVEAGATSVTLSAREVDGNVVFLTEDNGEGMAAAAGERVFDPFYTTREGKLGLGLTIARRIAALHGGVAEAAPGNESGTTVSYRIPKNR